MPCSGDIAESGDERGGPTTSTINIEVSRIAICTKDVPFVISIFLRWLANVRLRY